MTVRVTDAESFAKPTATVRLANQVTVGNLTDPAVPVPINGDVTVTAKLRTEADAIGFAPGGGVITVGVPEADATLDPAVDASIGVTDCSGATCPRSTRVHTAGSVTVHSELTTEGGTGGPTDEVKVASLLADTLTFSYTSVGHGDTVQYSLPVSGPAIGGLHAGADYTVLETTTDGVIRLGSLFSVSQVDGVRETITFPGGHPFQDGDCVYYDARWRRLDHHCAAERRDRDVRHRQCRRRRRSTCGSSTRRRSSSSRTSPARSRPTRQPRSSA